MNDANYMEVMKCKCGAEEICFCGRCKGCGSFRFIDKEKVKRGEAYARFEKIMELYTKSLVSHAVLIFERSKLLAAFDTFGNLDDCEAIPPTEQQKAGPFEISVENRLGIFESRLNALWTEVFSSSTQELPDKDGKAPGPRQTLRGAVMGLCSDNKSTQPGYGGHHHNIVRQPELPWGIK